MNKFTTWTAAIALGANIALGCYLKGVDNGLKAGVSLGRDIGYKKGFEGRIDGCMYPFDSKGLYGDFKLDPELYKNGLKYGSKKLPKEGE